MSIKARLTKLEDKVVSNDFVKPVRIIVRPGESKEDAILKWQNDNKRKVMPGNIIFRVII